MTRMSAATIAALRTAVNDPATVARYWAHVDARGLHDCWHWTGAISGRGHGRFQLGDAYDSEGRRQTFGVIAHRFGFALTHGVDDLLATPMVGHSCDNPLCQQPTHWRRSDAASNRKEWAARRREAGPLVDQRGARGRARALRDAILRGDDAADVAAAGVPAVYRDQISLIEPPKRAPSAPPPPAADTHTESTPAPGVEVDQPSLFD